MNIVYGFCMFALLSFDDDDADKGEAGVMGENESAVAFC